MANTPRALTLSSELKAALEQEKTKPEYTNLEESEAHLRAVAFVKRTNPKAFTLSPGDQLAWLLAD